MKSLLLILLMVLIWMMCSPQSSALCQKFTPSVEKKMKECAALQLPATFSKFSINDLCCKTQCEDEPDCHIFFFHQSNSQCRMSPVPKILILSSDECDDVTLAVNVKQPHLEMFEDLVQIVKIEVDSCLFTHNQMNFNQQVSENFEACSDTCKQQAQCEVFSFHTETSLCKLGNNQAEYYHSICYCNTADTNQTETVFVKESKRSFFKGCTNKKLISRNKFAQQSSTFDHRHDYGAEVASHAVDGNLNGNGLAGSCSITKFESSPWWRVDLGDIYHIARVNIYNRVDVASERLKNFEVLISNDEQTFKNCFDFPGSGAQIKLIPATCVGEGRFVQIQLRDANYLQLCEVEIFGRKI